MTVQVKPRREIFPLTTAELARFVSAAAGTLLVLAAVFVVWRRMAGAIAAPLPAIGMLFAGVLVAALGWTAHHFLAPGRLVVRQMAISLAILSLGVALSRGDSNAAGLVGFWAFILAEELWTWQNRLPASLLGKGNRQAHASTSDRAAPPHIASVDQEPVEPAADVMQQLTLRTTAEGGQELSGWLRMPLAAGQRAGTLHVAFCPPFDCLPRVEVEAVSGPACRVKAVEPMPYGVRLEIKLDAPAAERASVMVQFFAAVGNALRGVP